MPFQDRVKARIDALRESPIKLAEDNGLRREFIRDIVEGRKKTVRADKLDALAKALQCSVGYLQGADETPGAAAGKPEVRPGAICETGVWRIAALPSHGSIATTWVCDLRFPEAPTFEVRGDAMAGAGIGHGMIVVAPPLAGPIETIPNGAIVVLERTRASGEVEVSLRRATRVGARMVLSAVPAMQSNPFPDVAMNAITGEKHKVVGKVSMVTKTFEA